MLEEARGVDTGNGAAPRASEFVQRLPAVSRRGSSSLRLFGAAARARRDIVEPKRAVLDEAAAAPVHWRWM